MGAGVETNVPGAGGSGGDEVEFTLVDLVGPTEDSIVLTSRVIGDEPDRRWRMRANGDMEWGDGAGTYEWSMGRRTGNHFVLGKSDSEFQFFGAVAGGYAGLYITSGVVSPGGVSEIGLSNDNFLSGSFLFHTSASLLAYTNSGRIEFAVLGGSVVGPETDLTYDLGDVTHRWRTVYGGSFLGSDATLTGVYPYVAIIGDDPGNGNVSIKTGVAIYNQWEVDGYGEMSWSDGSTPTYVRLGRAAATRLHVTGSLSASEQFLAPVGSFAVPGFAFTAKTDFGWTTSAVGTYKDDAFYAAVHGKEVLEVYNDGAGATSGGTLSVFGVAYTGFYLASDALYATSYGSFVYDDDGGGYVALNAVALDLYIAGGAAKSTYFSIGGLNRWQINSSGHFIAYADNTYDIGATLATRPRRLHVGTAVVHNEWSVYRDSAAGFAILNSGSSGGFAFIGSNDPAFKYAVIGHDGTDVVLGPDDNGYGIRLASDVRIALHSVVFANGWEILSTGHFRPTVDNTYDIGALGANRPRNLYLSGSITVGGQYLAASGTVSAPGYAFTSSTSSGLYLSADGPAMANAGNVSAMFATTGIALPAANYFGFYATTIGSSVDVRLQREGAGVLAQKNGTNAQTFRVYGTTTGSFYLNLANDGASSYVTATGTSAGLNLGAGGSTRFGISGSSGHFYATPTNTYDIGITGALPRNIAYGTQLLCPDGTSSAPSIARASQTGFGLYFGAAQTINLAYSAGSRLSICPDPEAFTMGSAWVLQWTSGNLSTDTADVKLVRLGAGILGLRNSTNAQSFRVYGTTTGTVLTEINNDGTNGFVTVTGASGVLNLGTNSTSRWRVTSSGHLIGVADNTYDIGASNATRPRTGYFGTSLVVGGTSESGSLTPVIGAYGTASVWFVARDTDTDSEFFCGVSDATAYLGTRTNHPLIFQVNADDKWSITTLSRLAGAGNRGFSHGTSALATNATEGFFHLQSCAGTPSGTPASIPTGQIPMVWDSTNNLLYAYSSSAWVLVWQPSGHLIPSADNTYDLGSTSFGWRTLYADTSVVTPTLTVTSSDLTIQTVTSGGFVFSPVSDVISMRRSGSSSATMDFYDTYTNGSNYARLRVSGSSANLVLSQNAGTGPSRDLQIGTDTGVAAKLVILTQGSVRWNFVAAGHLEPQVDATYNLGSSTNNVNILYVNTIISSSNYRVGTNPATTGDIRLRNTATIQWRNAANSNNFVGFEVDSSNNLKIYDDAWRVVATEKRFEAQGNYGLSVGTSALATTATQGFLWIPSCAGTPTGVPSPIPTGQIALCYDSTNDKLYIYRSGWKRAQVAAVDAVYA